MLLKTSKYHVLITTTPLCVQHTLEESEFISILTKIYTIGDIQIFAYLKNI